MEQRELSDRDLFVDMAGGSANKCILDTELTLLYANDCFYTTLQLYR